MRGCHVSCLKDPAFGQVAVLGGLSIQGEGMGPGESAFVQLSDGRDERPPRSENFWTLLLGNSRWPLTLSLSPATAGARGLRCWISPRAGLSSTYPGPLAPRSEAQRREGWGEGRSKHIERGALGGFPKVRCRQASEA